MAYDCRDVAIVLRQLKLEKSQSTNTSHYERKKVFEPMCVLESKSIDKIKLLSFLASGNVNNVSMTSLIFDVIGRLCPKDQEKSQSFYCISYSSISCIKDRSIVTCANVTRLLLMFENLTLTLAKKRCE